MNDRALRVLEQYDLEVRGTRRGRGSWYLDTADGFRILSEYSASGNRAFFQNFVMGKIREGGYPNVDVILPNKEGELVSRDWEGNRYVVKEWYAGRECDASNEPEILAAVENLARLHRLMDLGTEDISDFSRVHRMERVPDPAGNGSLDNASQPQAILGGTAFREDGAAMALGGTDFRRDYTARPPLEELCAWNAQLRKIRSFIRGRHRKSSFEQLFLENFEQYYEQAREAREQLSLINDRLEALHAACDGHLCHGDYSHHHVLMCGYETATTNFDHCCFDFQVNDLYRFMRKILEKHDWNVRLGVRMLESYGRVRTIPYAERKLIYVRMLYPEKFRKLAGAYYGSNKAWISRQYSDKLGKINRQEAARQEFIRALEKI